MEEIKERQATEDALNEDCSFPVGALAAHLQSPLMSTHDAPGPVEDAKLVSMMRDMLKDDNDDNDDDEKILQVSTLKHFLLLFVHFLVVNNSRDGMPQDRTYGWCLYHHVTCALSSLFCEYVSATSELYLRLVASTWLRHWYQVEPVPNIPPEIYDIGDAFDVVNVQYYNEHQTHCLCWPIFAYVDGHIDSFRSHCTRFCARHSKLAMGLRFMMQLLLGLDFSSHGAGTHYCQMVDQNVGESLLETNPVGTKQSGKDMSLATFTSTLSIYIHRLAHDISVEWIGDSFRGQRVFNLELMTTIRMLLKNRRTDRGVQHHVQVLGEFAPPESLQSFESLISVARDISDKSVGIYGTSSKHEICMLDFLRNVTGVTM